MIVEKQGKTTIIFFNPSRSINNDFNNSFQKIPHDDLAKKCSYLKRKQKELHLLLKRDSNISWKEL